MTLDQIGDSLLGLHLEAKDFQLYQTVIRALILFFALLIMIRVAGRRFLVNRNPLDILVSFILASMLSRAINGSAPFFLTIVTGFFVVVLYRAVAYLACRFRPLGRWLKGMAEPVIQNGRVQKKVLDRHHVSEDDLMEDLRLNGHVNSTKDIRLAQIERNGSISILKSPGQTE